VGSTTTYGITRLKDTQVVDLEPPDYSRLKDREAFIFELVTPFILESEYPNARRRCWSSGRSTIFRLRTTGRW